MKRHQRPRRICLFGTSANPPTGSGGHAGLVQALMNLQKFDEVRVLPVYQHTFASKRNQLLGFDHRVAMCELAVQGLSALPDATATATKQDESMISEISDGVVNTVAVVSRAEEDSFRRMLASSDATTDEEKAALRVGTADLLEMLMEDEDKEQKNNDAAAEGIAIPKTEFSFCLGADTFLDLTDWKWKRSRDVLRLLEGRLVVVNRKGEDGVDNNTGTTKASTLRKRIEEINATPLGNGMITLLDVPTLGDVSSSKIRNAENKELVKHMLSPKVLEYVIANNLYGFGTDQEDGNIIG